MRVLEVLQEEDKPLRLINPDELDITNPEEKKLKKEIEKTSSIDVATARRFGIDDAGIKKMQAKASGKKWQDRLSMHSWYLIFYVSNVNRFKNMNPGSIKYKCDSWYKTLVQDPGPMEPISNWVMNASNLANLYTTHNDAEDILKELIGRIQNIVGVTIGPSWKIGGSDTPKSTFFKAYEKYLQVVDPNTKPLKTRIRTTATAIEVKNLKAGKKYKIVSLGDTNWEDAGVEKDKPALVDTEFTASGGGEGTGTARPVAGENDNTPVLTDKPLTSSEASNVAGKLNKVLDGFGLPDFISDADDQEILAILRDNIKNKKSWDLVKTKYKEFYDGKDLTKEIFNDLKDDNDKVFNNWLAGIEPGLAVDQTAISTYSKEANSKKLSPVEIVAVATDFENKFLQKEPKYADFVNTTTGRKIWDGNKKAFYDQIKEEMMEESPPRLSMGRFKEIFVKWIKAFKDTADEALS